MIAPDPAQIIVPRRHGEILINPPLSALAAALPPPSAGQPFTSEIARRFFPSPADARKIARTAAAIAIQNHARAIGDAPPQFPADAPWIITGHQVEFYHAGVWAKVIAADRLAKKTNGIAIDLLVDHDLLDEMGFDVPAKSESDIWQRQPVLLGSASPLPAEFLSAPSTDAFAAWKEQLAHFPEAQSDALQRFLSELALPPDRPSDSYTVWMSRARRRFEKSLGLAVAHVPTTAICSGLIWETFIAAWIASAPEWTAIYNRHLAEYRHRQKIKRPEHPMPDLIRDESTHTYELPFWIYRQNEPRARLMIRDLAHPAILYQNSAHPITADLLSGRSGFFIRPRALTLTMFVRLFLADLFIHGIGGALYDQITDAILRDLFGPDAAASYGCVSAAWLLPFPPSGENPASLPTLKWQLHHLTHNPQLFMTGHYEAFPPAAAALSRRRELLELIADSLEINRRLGREARRNWFNELHAVNAQLHDFAPEKLVELVRRVAAAEKSARENKILQWREWFFALHSLSSLQEMVDKITG